MKQIILIRHAQTAGKQAGQRDFDRSLTSEGEAQARALGKIFVTQSVHPDYLLSSSAARTRQTAELINESLRITPGHIAFRDELYETDTSGWIDGISQLPPYIKCVVCIGHNPVISVLASHFAGHEVDLAPASFARFESVTAEWTSFLNNLQENNSQQ